MPRAAPGPYTVLVPPPNSSQSGDGTPASSQRRLDSRWTVLAAAMIAECAGCGIGYAFGIYSPLLKSQFGLTQTQLNTTNAVSMIISVPPFCFFFAWIYDRFGPRVSQKLGAFSLFVGYGLTCAMIKGWLGEQSPAVAVVLLSAGSVAMNLGSALVGIGGVASTIKSFPIASRGVVTGLVKTGNGISSGIYTQLYLGFLAPDILGFLVMTWLASSITVFICSFFLGVDTSPMRPEERAPPRLSFATGVIVVLLGIILVTAFVDRTAAPQSPIVLAGAIAVLVVFSSLLAVPFRAPMPPPDDNSDPAANTTPPPADDASSTAGMSDYRREAIQLKAVSDQQVRCHNIAAVWVAFFSRWHNGPTGNCR